MSEKNPRLDCQLVTYPAPVRFKLMIAHAATQGLSKSKVLDEALKFYIEKNFNDLKQRQLIDFFDNKMTPEQRKYPDKYWDLKEKQ